LSKLDQPYADLQGLLSTEPLRVVELAPGAFRRYYTVQQRSGADLAHLKPPHMNPSDAQITLLTDPQTDAG
jgi:hypothetical protein